MGTPPCLRPNGDLYEVMMLLWHICSQLPCLPVYLLFPLAIPGQLHLEKASHRLSLTPLSSLTLQRTLKQSPALKLKPSYADFMSAFLQYGFLRAEVISHRHVHVFPLLVTDTSSIPYNFTNSFHTSIPYNLIQHLSSPSPQNCENTGVKKKKSEKEGKKTQGTGTNRKPEQTLLLRKSMSKEQLGLVPVWQAMIHASPSHQCFILNFNMTSSTPNLMYLSSFHSRGWSFPQASKGIPPCCQ